MITYKEYKQARRKAGEYMPASYALSMLKGGKAETIKELDGFTITFQAADDSIEVDWLGKFTDNWQEGALETKAGRGYYKYFIPEYSVKERIQDNRRYMAKNQAYLSALFSAKADMGKAKEPDSYFVMVTASLSGIDLGSASVGGICYSTINEAVNELAFEAVEEAKKNLANLLDKAKQVA